LNNNGQSQGASEWGHNGKFQGFKPSGNNSTKKFGGQYNGSKVPTDMHFTGVYGHSKNVTRRRGPFAHPIFGYTNQQGNDSSSLNVK
jgi:hypothetical protein